jgi:hypothetical protein
VSWCKIKFSVSVGIGRRNGCSLLGLCAPAGINGFDRYARNYDPRDGLDTDSEMTVGGRLSQKFCSNRLIQVRSALDSRGPLIEPICGDGENIVADWQVQGRFA